MALCRGILIAILVVDLVHCHFINQWAVEIEDESQVEAVAAQLNCRNKGKILDGIFLFEHDHVTKRSANPHDGAHQSITEHAHVKWAEQQKVLSRKKRQMWRLPPPSQAQKYEDFLNLNDQRWPQMWYLNRGGKLDMNVQEAWLAGATGKGVSITILDDGIERSHPDLVANYDHMASYDVNDNDDDPTPRYDLIDSNRHGTRCAGEVSATANNSECAVGIAYESGIGGVRMLDGDVTDAVEARSLNLNNQHVAIYSASWGPDDDGKTVDGPGRLATQAFLQGIAKGRGGKGSIFVWASGNGGRDKDNCNCDGYTNSVWTLSVSSATENGFIPWYSEACSSTLASTYSSGSSGERKVVTTDLHHICTSSHTGTSASAPLAAGIVALILQVNPSLNWRDVQHLTVRCAHVANLRATDWAVNGVGRNFSHSFGYGIMDASCMVRTARVWEGAGEQRKCSRSADRIDLIIPGRQANKATIQVKDCSGDGVNFLEHVQAQVTLSATKRGDVAIFLISPSGTRSSLIAKRPRDYSRAGFQGWPFLTVHNDGRSIVELKEWSLSFLGTSEEPQIVKAEPSPESPSPSDKPPVPSGPIAPVDGAEVPNLSVPGSNLDDVSKQMTTQSQVIAHCKEQMSQEWCSVCETGFIQHNGRCVDSCPAQGYFLGESNRASACIACYYSCQTCNGPNDYQCSSCFGDATLEEESPTQRFCYNKSLIQRVFYSSRWYYVLSVGFLINLFIVVILVVYIMRWRRSRDRVLPTRANGTVNRKYSPGKLPGDALLSNPLKGGNSSSAAITVPFHDYDSSSEEDQLYRKPYSDNA
ncbi:hypothetical protein TCAL_03361 [Tigriopus californicus]|uniref:furin n=1 Tax=Tigriopus californicus TaxID=6832 RepID=A0A553P8L8_TIGCA|nr:hypothetical protein TCAL_03361 [Tigriopus californicus]|eukprot:TCALIF_03361-PA protein Name:"Similar to Fur1 Furin-like protease 1, isoform 1-CRR (Drosophila melanogaster)" AED:0.09 eAED:0.09 QI:926/0.88/0.9/1/0.55/0.6/10/525/814